MVCVIQLSDGDKVEIAENEKVNSEEKLETSEPVKDQVTEENGTGVENQESCMVEGGAMGKEDHSTVKEGELCNSISNEDVQKPNDGDKKEEPMETGEHEVVSRVEELVREATEVPADKKADSDKTGLTPDKIDLAACRTPAKRDDQSSPEGEEKKSAPTMTMRFVDETVETSKEDTSRNESRDEDNMETDNHKGEGDAFDDMRKGKKAAEEKSAETKEDPKLDNGEEGGEKPSSGLKLASFSTMAQKSPGAAGAEGEGSSSTNKTLRGGCAQCKTRIENMYEAIVWETMQFCNESCLGQYQGCMSNCSSCKKEVVAASLGKYCVRFGSDIKQFCSNICLEDYKKGLKVCSYCQKDISGGEGFLAPIGDKGQFKDFCDGGCLKKYEHIYLGKAPDPETLPCNVCKEV